MYAIYWLIFVAIVMGIAAWCVVRVNHAGESVGKDHMPTKSMHYIMHTKQQHYSKYRLKHRHPGYYALRLKVLYIYNRVVGRGCGIVKGRNK